MEHKVLVFRKRFCHCYTGCSSCGKAFLEGDRIVSRITGGGKRIAFHEGCWAAKFIG